MGMKHDTVVSFTRRYPHLNDSSTLELGRPKAVGEPTFIHIREAGEFGGSALFAMSAEELRELSEALLNEAERLEG